jgi:subtilisin-like proprotein convertase family protein
MELGLEMHKATRYTPLNRVSAIALTTCVGLLVGISSAAEKSAVNDHVAKRDQSSIRLMSPNAKLSRAMVQTQSGSVEYIVSDNLIVRTNDRSALEQLISGIAKSFPGVELGRALNADQTLFVVRTSDVSTAIKVRSMISGDSAVESVMLDQAPARDNRDALLRQVVQQRANTVQTNAAIGIEPISIDDPLLGGSGDPDTLSGAQWYLVNTVNADRDNNITPAIFDTMGILGTGVAVGVSALNLNEHVDTDHFDLIANYSPALTQPFDPNLLADNRVLTGYVGLIGAERGNGIAGQGIAPGSTVATMNWGPTPLLEFEAYDWKNNDLAIKVFQTSVEFDFPGGAYNNGNALDYVTGSLENSIRFGRGGRGIVNIFGTGVGFNLLPDPYNFPPAGAVFSPTDELQANHNIVADGLTNGFLQTPPPPDPPPPHPHPYYVGGQVSFYPPAVDRRSIVMNTVSEDGYYDSLSGMGTSVFASVYGGSSNELWSGSQATSGRGASTTSPGAAGDSGLIPLDGTDVFNANGTGTSITAGIIALMLEANSRLSIRDIQHIFFETIQEDPRASSIKWPDFDVTRPYYFPDDPQMTPMGFWGVNSGLYTGDGVIKQAIRHSDQYGFGVVNAELAVTKASTWGGTPRLFLLDSGVVGDVNDGSDTTEDFRVPAVIADATFNTTQDADGATGQSGFSDLIPGAVTLFNFCVRQNISIESIILELTISGDGSNDLFIELTSPTGTRSILSMPNTRNFAGTAQADNPNDDERDQNFNSGNVGNTNYAFYQHPFLTWKHWGEYAGGVWTVAIVDYGPDAVTPQGTPAGTGPMPDPGADMLTDLGEIGVPGSTYRTQKTIEGFRVKIYGTETGEPIFVGCPPATTSCPGDLDGNGIIDVADLQIYVSWYISNNALADIDGDGDIDFNDLFAYRTLWIPGFCNRDQDPFAGGRPRPGGTDFGSDNDPVVNPI